MSYDESLRLLEAAKTTRFPRRDHAVFRLFLTSGCTLSELLGLTRRDVDLAARKITFKGRGGRRRTLTLSPGALAALRAYEEVRPLAPADGDAFFINRLGRPITKGAIYHALQKALAAARIETSGVTVHTLRHTCLKLLWQAGVSVYVIQEIAGHCAIATTREYGWGGPDARRPRRWRWVHPLDAEFDVERQDAADLLDGSPDESEWDAWCEEFLHEKALRLDLHSY